MPARQLHLAAYDIRSSRRLAAALHLVRSHATGGQKSVHEIFLTQAEKHHLLQDMHLLLDDQDDRFLLLRLDTRATVHTRGQGLAPADPDYIYLS